MCTLILISGWKHADVSSVWYGFFLIINYLKKYIMGVFVGVFWGGCLVGGGGVCFLVFFLIRGVRGRWLFVVLFLFCLGGFGMVLGWDVFFVFVCCFLIITILFVGWVFPVSSLCFTVSNQLDN